MTTASAALASTETPAESAGGAAPAAANDNAAASPAAAGAALGPSSGAAAVARLDWVGDDAPEDLHAFATANGYKGPADVLQNVRELQKYLGADKAGRGLVVPADADDAEAWGALYAKLGRPDAPDGYGLHELEGADPEFARSAAETFHKLGLNERQAAELSKWWGESMEAGAAAESTAYLERADAEMKALREEWGNAANQNEEIARRGAQAFGFSGEELDKIERAIGTKSIMARFLEVGRKVGEDSVPAGKSATGGLSPAAAQEQIAQLLADRDFAAKLRAGDGTAKAKLEKLYQSAYPG